MNTVLELDFAIDRSGRVEPSHAALYKAFGDWRRSCYGTPVASGALNHTGAVAVAPFSLETTSVPTRVHEPQRLLKGVHKQAERGGMAGVRA